ncbi:MAG TPA: DUF454 family protein [Thermoanaerobaculia bacterium]
MSSPAPVEAPPHRKSRVRRNKLWNLVLAIFFFILGFIGLLIPIMPQVLFFVLGIIFLSLVSPTVRRRVRKFLHAHPKLAHHYKRWRDNRRLRRREMIRRRKALAQKLHLHREGNEDPSP